MDFNFDELPESAFGGAGVEPELVTTLVNMLEAAPRALSLNDVMNVLAKSEIEAPAKTTVRSYLNRAVADGRASKPSRQTYGAAGAAVVADAVDADAVSDNEDPLADL